MLLYNFEQLQIIVTIVINCKNFDQFWDLWWILINDNFDMTIVTMLKTVHKCDNYDLLWQLSTVVCRIVTIEAALLEMSWWFFLPTDVRGSLIFQVWGQIRKWYKCYRQLDIFVSQESFKKLGGWVCYREVVELIKKKGVAKRCEIASSSNSDLWLTLSHLSAKW